MIEKSVILIKKKKKNKLVISPIFEKSTLIGKQQKTVSWFPWILQRNCESGKFETELIWNSKVLFGFVKILCNCISLNFENNSSTKSIRQFWFEIFQLLNDFRESKSINVSSSKMISGICILFSKMKIPIGNRSVWVKLDGRKIKWY